MAKLLLNSAGKVLTSNDKVLKAPEGLIIPYGTIDITTTEEVDVGAYKTAQVVDSNLIADNIKKDISILGVTGTYEGESSSGSPFKAFIKVRGGCDNLFENMTMGTVDDILSYNDTNDITSMEYMFSKCTNLQTIPQLDTSKVTDMENIFSSCSNLQTIPQLNTSKVTNMYYMFYGCENLQTILQLNTSNATNMSYMFRNCTNLQTIPQLNTSNVTRITYMFSECTNLQTIDITSLDKISSANNLTNFAAFCFSLTKFIIRTMTKIPSLNSNSFTNCYHFTGTVNTTYNPEGLKDGRIYVPDDKVEELKAATNWSVYADIIVPLSTLQEA